MIDANGFCGLPHEFFLKAKSEKEAIRICEENFSITKRTKIEGNINLPKNDDFEIHEISKDEFDNKTAKLTQKNINNNLFWL